MRELGQVLGQQPWGEGPEDQGRLLGSDHPLSVASTLTASVKGGDHRHQDSS